MKQLQLIALAAQVIVSYSPKNKNTKVAVVLAFRLNKERPHQKKSTSIGLSRISWTILKNLFDAGIGENDIIAIKTIIDILLYNSGKDMEKLNDKREVINDLSSYSNLKLAKENLNREINAILSTENLEKIQNHIDSLNKTSSLSVNNSENLKERKYIILCDSII